MLHIAAILLHCAPSPAGNGHDGSNADLLVQREFRQLVLLRIQDGARSLNRIFIFLVFLPYSGISLTSFAQDSALHPRSGAGSKAILAFSNLREFNAIASPPANNMIAITNVTLIDGLGKLLRLAHRLVVARGL